MVGRELAVGSFRGTRLDLMPSLALVLSSWCLMYGDHCDLCQGGSPPPPGWGLGLQLPEREEKGEVKGEGPPEVPPPQ